MLYILEKPQHYAYMASIVDTTFNVIFTVFDIKISQ